MTLPWWSEPTADLLTRLETAPGGLAPDEAARRLASHGRNQLDGQRVRPGWHVLVGQVKSPLVLLLVGAAALSFFVGSHQDALIILGIVGVGVVLGFRQELKATRAVESLLGLVSVRARVLRGGAAREVPTEEVVPGDVVLLSAGSLVPADCRLLAERDLHVDQATLTGESFPVEKELAAAPPDAPLAGRGCAVLLGTHVVSGTATAVVVETGPRTELGAISGRLHTARPATNFEQGVQRFGAMLLRATVLLVLVIFATSVGHERAVLESFLFAIALAVGLVPELLPAIVNVTLAQGAKRLARDKVVVKRLAAIEDFGSMDVLCSDKTGTLTAGLVRLEAALGIDGAPSEDVLLWAAVNATLETGLPNPLDAALEAACPIERAAWKKLDEVPYDFVRKRLSVLVEHEGRSVLVTKGALARVLEACSTARARSGALVPLASVQADIDALHGRLAADGFRTLGVAVRTLDAPTPVDPSFERDLTFLGLLAFFDPPREGIQETLARLAALGIRVVLVTGDDHLVAASVARRAGLTADDVVTGAELHELSDDALSRRSRDVDVFAEVEPNQKERIILALKRAGAVVGYLGDGINDAPALHAADVGVSVSGAADVARQSADIVLLEPDLRVLEAGVREGRRTFANTLKYVYITTSANFGNMFSMAGAALFMPFLPLLPKQILLNNLLSDFPAMAIAGDAVDPEQVQRPRRWDTRQIRAFMLLFGGISSVFDVLTFVTLLHLQVTPEQFRSGWFLESLWTELLILLVMRTPRPFFRSRPSRAMIALTIAVFAASLAAVFGPFRQVLGFAALPLPLLAMVAGITLAYLGTSELAKRRFFSRAAA